jgi:hypothetical protein
MNAEIQKELDNLIEQSMSFAKSVSNNSIGQLAKFNGADGLTRMQTSHNAGLGERQYDTTQVEAVLSERPSAPIQKKFAPMIWPDYGRQEIDQRVANFRAHQQKMTREREEFFVQTMAKALASKNRD